MVILIAGRCWRAETPRHAPAPDACGGFFRRRAARSEASWRPSRHLRRVVAVHAVERGGEAVRIAFAPHLAVGDDVETGAFLVADGENGRVVLRLLEHDSLDAPEFARARSRRDDFRQPLAVDQPVWLRIASHQRVAATAIRCLQLAWVARLAYREICLKQSRFQRSRSSLSRTTPFSFAADRSGGNAR